MTAAGGESDSPPAADARPVPGAGLLRLQVDVDVTDDARVAVVVVPARGGRVTRWVHRLHVEESHVLTFTSLSALGCHGLPERPPGITGRPRGESCWPGEERQHRPV